MPESCASKHWMYCSLEPTALEQVSVDGGPLFSGNLSNITSLPGTSKSKSSAASIVAMAVPSRPVASRNENCPLMAELREKDNLQRSGPEGAGKTKHRRENVYIKSLKRIV